MGLLQTLSQFLGRLNAGGVPDDLDDYWYGPRTRAVAANVAVSAEHALQLTTVSSCVKVISETVATVPLIVYREIAAGKERAPDDPRTRLLRRRPNRWQNGLMWREMMTGHAALRGRAYAEMVGQDVEQLELVPRHPDRVRVLECDDAGFSTVYGIRNVGTSVERQVARNRMFVLLGPWGGRSPVEAHREAIGLGLAMQEQAARYFGNGSRPGGILKAPEKATFSQEQRDRIKQSWEDAHRGPTQAHKVAVLEGGLEWQQIGISAEDSQFIQSRQFHVSDICRIWNVPPYKVQEYGRATWSNTEQMAIDFLTTCMLPWFRRWEEAIQWHLINDDEPIIAEFLLEGLLRGDTAARFAAYQIATGGRPWMAPNEVRERENMNRVDGLDEVATTAQGAPNPAKPSSPMRETPPGDDDNATTPADGERRSASRIWASWTAGIADSFVRAEDRELEAIKTLEAKDAARAADYARTWYRDKYQATVRARMESMCDVWRGALSYEATIQTLVATGVEWALTSREPAARKAAILAVLAEGRNDDLAA